MSESIAYPETRAVVSTDETITAISTPPGRGGIGIVRLSGPSALQITAQVLELPRALGHARATLAILRDPQSSPDNPRMLDQAMVTAHLAPRSYTGEDLVEIATHGSPVVLETLLASILGCGARLAEPGEFTQRAFLAGHLDLTQAEAVHDLIAAHTLEQARAAAQQLGGALSRRLHPTKERLLHLLALLEAGMDFASGELDDVDVVQPFYIAAELAELQLALDGLARSFRAGSLLRSGAALALIGRPNAGKSSLFNRLLERPRAIVTPLPGTTRDTVEEIWSLEGIPLRLIDTAGLRLLHQGADNQAEREGIERSREALADADLVLFIQDATAPLSEEERTLLESLHGRPHILVRNKTDLLHEADLAGLSLSAGSLLPVSALTGEGVPALKTAILAQLRGSTHLGESAALTTHRQYEAVTAAITAVMQAAEANMTGLPHEVLLLDLHTALRHIDLLTGETTADDILGRIFSTFCIGK